MYNYYYNKLWKKKYTTTKQNQHKLNVQHVERANKLRIHKHLF